MAKKDVWEPFELAFHRLPLKPFENLG